MPQRRTITVDDTVHLLVNRVRARFLDANIELDYTRAINLLLALGLKTYNTNPMEQGNQELIRAFAFNEHLKSNAILDELQDALIKELPAALKQQQG